MLTRKRLPILLAITIGFSPICSANTEVNPHSRIYDIYNEQDLEPIGLIPPEKPKESKKVFMYGNEDDKINLELNPTPSSDKHELFKYFINTNSGNDYLKVSTPEKDSSKNILIDTTINTGNGNDKVALKLLNGSASVDAGDGDDKIFVVGEGEIDILSSKGNNDIVLYQVGGRSNIHFNPSNQGKTQIFGRSSFNLMLPEKYNSEDLTFFRYLSDQKVNSTGLTTHDTYDESSISSSMYVLHNISAKEFYNLMLEANNLTNYNSETDGDIFLSDELFDKVEATYLKIDNANNVINTVFEKGDSLTKELVKVKSMRDSLLIFEVDYGVSDFAYVNEFRGTEGDDALIGDSYKNILHASSGNDDLYGTQSKDIYEVYPNLEGITTIWDGLEDSLIVFNSGIERDQLSYRVYKSDLYVKVTDSYEIKIHNWLYEKHVRRNGGMYTFYFKDSNEILTQDELDKSLDLDVRWILLKEAMPTEKTLKMKLERRDDPDRREGYIKPKLETTEINRI